MSQQSKYRQNEWDAAAMDHEERKAIDKNSGRTAISRKALSVPARYLLKNKLITGSILDYGCDKGGDVKRLAAMNKMIIGYDPNSSYETRGKFFRGTEAMLSPYKFDTILCTYVLNVVQHHRGQPEILERIKFLLHPAGVAYITVRRDIKKEGINKRGTYQRNVVLNLPVVRETSTYCIYKLEK